MGWVAGSGPGLCILPSTIGYVNHDCTRVASPAYSLARRPSKGKASWSEHGVLGLAKPPEFPSSTFGLFAPYFWSSNW